jgi:hypothetical protein
MAVVPSPSIGSRGIAACGKRVHDQCLSFPSGKKGLTVSYPKRTQIRKPVAYPRMTRRGRAYLRVIPPMQAVRNWKELSASFARNPSTSQNAFKSYAKCAIDQGGCDLYGQLKRGKAKGGFVSGIDEVVLLQSNTLKGGEVNARPEQVHKSEQPRRRGQDVRLRAVGSLTESWQFSFLS